MLDDPAHVSLGARRVEHAEPDGVTASQPGTGDQRRPALFQGPGQGQPAALGLGLVAAGPLPPEADDAQHRGRHQGEVRMAADQRLGELGQAEAALDRGPERGQAEGLHGHPDLERPEPAGQLQATVGEVDLAVAVGVVVVEVVGVNGERALQPGAVADQDTAALHRLEQPLVRVQGHRVRALDPGQQLPSLRSQRREAAVRRVHVQPQSFRGAHVSQVRQRIDGPGVSGPAAGAQGERDPARLTVGAHGGSHRPRLQPPAVVGGQHPDLVRPQPHRPGGPGQGGVSLVGHVHDLVL